MVIVGKFAVFGGKSQNINEAGTGIEMTFAVFIVGSGRSGTHFTARAISGFENIDDPHSGNEFSEILYPIAIAAIEHQVYPEKVKSYYNQVKHQFSSTGKVFIDQHHPNLFFVEDLRKIFSDNAVFIYPDRPTVQVVASMFKHPGVLSWYKYALKRRWFKRALPYPNQFLGIRDQSFIDGSNQHLACAYRVIAHKKRMLELVRKYDCCRFVNYENLVMDQESEFQRIFSTDELESLGNFTIKEKPKTESLSKYKDVLSKSQISEIEQLEKFELG